MVTESPLETIEKLKTPSLEKILVDIFSNEMWESLQGYELVRIFENATNRYSINKSKLLRYATRKGKKEEIINFLNTNKLAII